MTLSQEITGRYSKEEREADKLGRVISVRRLKISEQTRISELTPGLEGVSEVELPESKDADGNVTPARTVQISRRSQMLVAAAVRSIDTFQISFPRSRGELDAIADALDEEGLVAAMIAYARLQPKSAEGEADQTAVDQAKK